MNESKNLMLFTNQETGLLQISTYFKSSYFIINYLYLQQPGKALYALSVALYLGVS